MKSMCGSDCCAVCGRRDDCGGCVKTEGRPFGGTCVAAECVRRGGQEALLRMKQALIEEFNALGISGLQIDGLNLLNGFYVNLEYSLANGQKVKFLEDNKVYWGNQIEISDSDRCYGIAADETYLLVCAYGCQGADPELICYKKRG